MLDVFLDALIDSAKILGIVFAFHVLLSFIEGKIAKFLASKRGLGPVIGGALGVIPECGVSVVGADLFSKQHITMGTLIAIFLACSDESLPILFNFSGSKHPWWMVFVLIAIKIVVGVIVGVLVDLISIKSKMKTLEHHHDCEGEDETDVRGCCGHHIEEENKLKEHLLHPLFHSLKIFVYAFIISFIFGTIVFYVGQDKISAFVSENKYTSPLFSIFIGMIPNCVSSVLLSELWMSGVLPFGALVAGLCMNAGLGMLYLFKQKDKAKLKNAFIVFGVCFVTSLAIGYILLPLFA